MSGLGAEGRRQSPDGSPSSSQHMEPQPSGSQPIEPQPSGSQPIEPQPSAMEAEESPPHVLRSGIRFRNNRAVRRPDAEVIGERAQSFESAFSYLKEVGFFPYESPQ